MITLVIKTRKETQEKKRGGEEREGKKEVEKDGERGGRERKKYLKNKMKKK